MDELLRLWKEFGLTEDDTQVLKDQPSASTKGKE